MLKNRDKDDFHRTYPLFCAEYTYTLYLKTLHQYCVYPAENSH